MTKQEFLKEHKQEVIVHVDAEGPPLLREGRRVRMIDLNREDKVGDEESLFREFYERGGFGGHFGFNWNAMIDSLTATYDPQMEYVVFRFHHYRSFEKKAKAAYDELLEVFMLSAYRTKYETHSYELILLLVDD